MLASDEGLDVSAAIVRGIVVLALAVSAAAAAYVWHPTKHLVDEIGQPNLGQAFPLQFGEWREDHSMPVILPAPDVQAKLDAIYNQVLSRTYISQKGERIMLSVAYGGDQSDGTRAHRPEVCYPAQGFQIMSGRTADLDIGAPKKLHVKQLMAKLGGRDEPITYWVVVGDKVATSSSEQKLAQLRFGIRGIIPDGMLVRVSSIDNEPERAQRVQQKFISDLHQAMALDGRARVFGT